jgi:hypothetical protein
MPQVSRVLRKWTDAKGRHGITWWCPGCRHAHSVATDGGAGPVWDFDGNLEAPTISPSFRKFIPAMPDHPRPEYRAERTTCHIWLKAGVIEFLNDCRHELRGFHPMTDLSTIEGYGWGYD